MQFAQLRIHCHEFSDCDTRPAASRQDKKVKLVTFESSMRQLQQSKPRNGMLSPNKTKLVKLAAALALLSTASFGAMAEWTEIGNNDLLTVYADFNTIRRSGHMVKMWSLVDQMSPTTGTSGTYLSMRSRDEYDCKDERKRQLDISAHTESMGRGSVLYVDSTAGQWRSVAPGSIGEIYLKAACDIK